MCCDAASVAKRGSRFVGFDSRRNVSAFGFVFALEEQLAQNEVVKQRSNEVTKRAKSLCRRLALFTVSLADGNVLPGFLHCASRRVRKSEREEKASARSGRNDNVSRTCDNHWTRTRPERSARRRIGDFSKYRWTACAGRRRKV